MGHRQVVSSLATILLVCLVVSCGANHKLTGITVSPNSAIFTAPGETVQFTATGTFELESSRTRPPSSKDITSSVTWSSSNTAVATINSSGLATAVGPGRTSITATHDGVSGAATMSMSSSEGLGDLTSIQIIPADQTTVVVGEPAQFLAIGTFSTTPATQEITNLVRWVSSDVSIATINSAGLAISVGAGDGSTTITAIGTANSGAVITGTATLQACSSCGPVTLPQLSVYEVGLGSGTITSAPAGINCNPTSGSGTGCTGNFVLGTTVMLTAAADNGSTFVGWSANCVPVSATQCTITLNNNEPVGAIFNLAGASASKSSKSR
jgi:hypothetical protein